MLETNTLYITKEDGQEVAMEILFTFESDDLNRKYVVFVDPNDDSGEVYASIYDDDGKLLPIETDEEWEMVEEVLGAFSENEEE